MSFAASTSTVVLDGERQGSIRPLKLVGLCDALPGHRHSAAGQRISLARERLLGSETFAARLQPFRGRNDLIPHR